MDNVSIVSIDACRMNQLEYVESLRMTKVGSYITKFGVFVDQIKSKQTSLFGALFDHQLTRKGVQGRIFLTRKGEISQFRLGRRLAERTINTDLQLALAMRVSMWFSYNPEESGGKTCAKKSQYHISSIGACKERGTT